MSLSLLILTLETLRIAHIASAQQHVPLFESAFASRHLEACSVKDTHFRECAGKTHKCRSNYGTGYDGNYCLIQCGVCGMNPDMGTAADETGKVLHSSPLYINDGVYLHSETDQCFLPTTAGVEDWPGSCYLQAIRVRRGDASLVCFELKIRRQAQSLVTVTFDDLNVLSQFQRGLAHDALYYYPVEARCDKVMSDRSDPYENYCYKATPLFRSWNFFQCIHKRYATAVRVEVRQNNDKIRPQGCQMYICEVSVGFSYWTCAVGWYPAPNEVMYPDGLTKATFGCKRCKDRCRENVCMDAPAPYCPPCPVVRSLAFRGKSCRYECPPGCANPALCDRWTGRCLECAPLKYGWLCDRDCDRCFSKCDRLTGACVAGECAPGRWNSAVGCKDTCPSACHLSCNSSNGACTRCTNIMKYGAACDRSCPASCKGGVCHFTGKCLECDQGKYGDSCSQTCPSTCSAYCKQSGSCYETCASNVWGRDCENSCPINCKPGPCEKSTGFCINGCLPGYIGGRCDIPCVLACKDQTCFSNDTRACKGSCAPTYYTPTCGEQCPENCLYGQCKTAGATYTCTLGCTDGFAGLNCSTPCSGACTACLRNSKGTCTACITGYHGTGCRYPCEPGCKSGCSMSSGECLECNPGFWGPTCSATCQYCKGAVCDRLTGACQSGCMKGFYGTSCVKICSHHCQYSECQQDGACTFGCTNDMTGPKCDLGAALWHQRYWFVIFILNVLVFAVYGCTFAYIQLEGYGLNDSFFDLSQKPVDSGSEESEDEDTEVSDDVESTAEGDVFDQTEPGTDEEKQKPAEETESENKEQRKEERCVTFSESKLTTLENEQSK